MITPDDNAYGRVKRWREKNRVLANLRQKEYRRRKRLGLVEKEAESGTEVSGPEMARKSQIEELRELIRGEEEKTVVEPERRASDVVGGIYRNDQGGVITKFAWEKLQRMKEKAKKAEYHLDEYIQ